MSASCRTSALRFLKIRPRSVAELKGKLEIKGFEAKEIKETLDWLQNIKLLDDRSFTRSWIHYRLARPFGFRRIILELKTKGVDPDIIVEEAAVIKEDHDESKSALKLAQRRWQKLEGIEPIKKKKRIFDFLSRRGYPIDIVMKVLKKLC